MASYADALSFLLAIVLLTTLSAEAREIRNFSNFNPQEEQSPLKPEPELKNYNGHHFENHEIDIPTEEFIANINKDSAQGNKEKDSNEFYYLRNFEPNAHNMDASKNHKFELTPEEKEFFNEKDRINGFARFNNERESVHAKEAQGMSDTRTLENGKYYYNPVRDNRADGKYKSEYKSKYDEFRHLEDFEFNPQNQVGFIP